MKLKILSIGLILFCSIDLFPIKSGKNFTNPLVEASLSDSIPVIHSSGDADANVYVAVEDPTQLTGNDYEVFFHQQAYYRNEFGEWIPIPPGKPNDNPSGTDTLTGSTIDMAAVYGPAAGEIELMCYLNLVSPDYNFADGISMTFPAGITVIEADSFEAGNGWVYPEIVGNTVNFGIVNGPPTGNGVFVGGEEWSLIISSFQPPLNVDWIIYDDGYSGGIVNSEGSTQIYAIGYATKTQNEWNLKNISTQDTVLKHQTVIMGYDIYTGEYVGDPVVEGFRISVDASYDLTTIGSVKVNGTELTYSESNVWWFGDNYTVSDFTLFGFSDGYANTSLPYYGGAGGTSDITVLKQDYEFRWTGILEDTVINGNTLTITKSGGSIITLFGASGYDLADHPLNPNPGFDQRFTVRIPFEVWNTNTGEQVNALFWDRSGDPTVNGGAVWNTTNREYLWLVNTPYSPDVIDETSQLVAENATWNEVFYLSTFTIRDVVKIVYINPIEFGVDLFNFTGVVSVEDERVPVKFQVFQNYPNPFNPNTTIKFSLPSTSYITLKIYNALGEEVEVLLDKELTNGIYEVEWNANNFSSGVYFYQLSNGKSFQTKKMLLIK
ncbi:MAG: T9SS type A sorting domain-containing protein [Ignavibacteriaceae bacterium]|nr:T9SS type A sorting domain-containing protein [Ignavibacteriaceae bacterium]